MMNTESYFHTFSKNATEFLTPVRGILLVVIGVAFLSAAGIFISQFPYLGIGLLMIGGIIESTLFMTTYYDIRRTRDRIRQREIEIDEARTKIRESKREIEETKREIQDIQSDIYDRSSMYRNESLERRVNKLEDLDTRKQKRLKERVKSIERDLGSSSHGGRRF